MSTTGLSRSIGCCVIVIGVNTWIECLKSLSCLEWAGFSVPLGAFHWLPQTSHAQSSTARGVGMDFKYSLTPGLA